MGGPNWTREQIYKKLRCRSDELAKGTLIENLPRELTIEGIAEHYQMSYAEIAAMILPNRHELK